MRLAVFHYSTVYRKTREGSVIAWGHQTFGKLQDPLASSRLPNPSSSFLTLRLPSIPCDTPVSGLLVSFALLLNNSLSTKKKSVPAPLALTSTKLCTTDLHYLFFCRNNNLKKEKMREEEWISGKLRDVLAGSKSKPVFLNQIFRGKGRET